MCRGKLKNRSRALQSSQPILNQNKTSLLSNWHGLEQRLQADQIAERVCNTIETTVIQQVTSATRRDLAVRA